MLGCLIIKAKMVGNTGNINLYDQICLIINLAKRQLWNIMILSRSKIIFLLITLYFIPKIGMCITVNIDSANSIIYSTNWSNWQWNMELPKDVVSSSISGTFDVVIEEGDINPYYGNKDPNTIQFSNINIYTSNPTEITWEFPIFKGKFNAPSIYAWENPCFLQTIPGSCFSIGEFGQYNGSFDGINLFISGFKNLNGYSGTGSFYYEISAQVVPLPASLFLFLSGLPLIFINKSRIIG